MTGLGISLACAALPWATAGASDLVGALRCRTCHPAAYEQWRQTPHARTFERLAPEQQRDPRCTACHATAAEEGHTGVQCESCHGAGRHYAVEAVMRDFALARAVGLDRGDDPAICGRCHTEDGARLVPFDAVAGMSRVRHHPPSGAH
jgi:formate-dependent nitrite reductase cytochrome c552 subunit